MKNLDKKMHLDRYRLFMYMVTNQRSKSSRLNSESLFFLSPQSCDISVIISTVHVPPKPDRINHPRGPLLAAAALDPCAASAAADLRLLHHSREIAQYSTCHTDSDFAGLDSNATAPPVMRMARAAGRSRPCRRRPARPMRSRTAAKKGALGLGGPMHCDDTRIGAGPGPMVRLDDYDIDRDEVTNLQ